LAFVACIAHISTQCLQVYFALHLCSFSFSNGGEGVIERGKGREKGGRKGGKEGGREGGGWRKGGREGGR